jgi:S1-C subfamily serine protease
VIVDIFVVLAGGLAAYRGWHRGLLGQMFELGGGLLGLILGVALGPRIADAFVDRASVLGALISLFVVFVLLSIGQAAGFIVGHRFGTVARRARLGPVDAAGGAAFGIVVVLVAFWIVGSLLVQGPLRVLSRALERSAILEGLNGALPPPPNLLAQIQQYLRTSGFPQVFVGIPPPSGPPVRLPSGAEARRAFEAADQSTVRVVVPACGGTQLGSGWIVDPDSVVTNAHVVAGGDGVTVHELGGAELSGEVVLFDPNADVAVLHVAGLSAPALEFDTATQERGTGGATLGYPGAAGGRLDGRRAAVQGQFVATGRDIYGRGEVERDIYELRARVRQGHSGGPFVLPDGRVVGVVFAASTTNPGIGYALTGTEVADEVRRGSQRTQPVSTGQCTH